MHIDQPLSGKRICIDPGHPSENGSGAAFGALKEVEIAWRVALRLRRLLTGSGAATVMTKSSVNQHVTNRARAQTANNFRADLALRLHCDDAPGLSGFATYYPDAVGRAPDGRRGPSLAVIESSKRLAGPFHTAVARSLGSSLLDRGLLTDRNTSIGRRQGALTGSIYSEVPVLLVEMCVLNSRHDAAFITNGGGEERLASALLHGIEAALI